MTTKPANEQLQAALEKALSEQSFASIEQAQAFAAQFLQKHHAQAVDDFQGLSPQQMRLLLYTPWDAPALIDAPTTLAQEPQAPITTVLQLLFDAIGDKGLKTTSTGNLPREFCRQAALHLWGQAEYAQYTRYGGINQEPDCLELHIARVLAQDSGLIRKYKGRFIVTGQARTLLKTGMRKIYPHLLRHYVSHFNWDYAHRIDAPQIIQMASCFTLYLLSLHGHCWQSNTLYEDAFIRAFPAALMQAPEVSWRTPEQTVRQEYFNRTLYRFAPYFGLAEVECINDDTLAPNYRVRATPLLGQVIRFHTTQESAKS